jgi:hypothetical protein
MSEYDIKIYKKPGQLYELLGVDESITDRELEAKILSMINEYNTAKITTNDGDDKYYEYESVINFMIDIYKYFFEDIYNDRDGEGDNVRRTAKPYDNMSEVVTEEVIKKKNELIEGVTERNIDEVIDEVIEDTVKKVKKSNTPAYYYPLQYATDENGQIINQSTKRIVSIHSGSRYNPTETTSSSFTLNLSETLKNVVKMKLYSISIPYSWYTISEDYGSNFFFFKGNSPGINNPTHDIRVQLEPGNYTVDTLLESLNTAIEHLQGKQQDESYYQEYNPILTDISLNNTNFQTGINASGRATMKIGIKNNYDSNYFRIRFPFTTPVYTNYNTKERNNDLSIPSFLGFTTNTVNSYTVRSDLSGNIPGGAIIDACNNTIKVLRYVSDNFDGTNISEIDGTNVFKTIDLDFKQLSGQITETTFNDILINNVDLDNNSNYTIEPSGNYLKLKLIREDSINNLNSKIFVLFPFNVGGENNMWTEELLFNYDGQTTYENISYNYKILNDVLSQEPTAENQYVVGASRTIKLEFEPQKTLYNGISENGTILTSDVSLNKFEMVITPNDDGYTVNELIEEFNGGFVTINESFADNHNISIFNNSSANADIMYLDGSNNLHIDIDISYNLGISNYELDLENTILGNLFFNDEIIFDLSLNGGVVEVDNTIQPAYDIEAAIFSYGNPSESLFKLTTKADSQIRNLPDIIVLPRRYGPSGEIIDFSDEVISLGTLITYCNDALTIYTNDNYNVPNLLSNSSFTTIVGDDDDNNGVNSGQFRLVMSMNVSDYLDETNYILYLTDSCGNDLWNNKFHFDASYDLSNNATIISNKTVDKDVITIIKDINDQMLIEPLPVGVDGGSNGVFDTLNRNTVNIIIPIGDYTRDELLLEINDLLKITTTTGGKILANDMSFLIKTINDIDYCLIDFNVNRMFIAEDYKAVFFDNTFTNCNSPSTGIQNTTFDSTVGYILGFRDKNEYPLISVSNSTVVDVKKFTGAQQININIYNEFSIVLDDYNNNRLPSAIVSGEAPITNFALPSYAKRTAVTCDENGNLLLSTKDKNNNNLTEKQLSAIYANIETSETKQSDISISNRKVNARDVFAIIPLNLTGLTAGELFVKEGITLQEQERNYFGPVDIQRITVKLLTDKGTLVNLNKDNWSFSFVCEQIHDQKVGKYITNPSGD